MKDARGIFWPEHSERETRWSDLEDRVREFWHLRPLPYPRFDLPVACPGAAHRVGDSGPRWHEALWIPRLWRFFLAPEASSYRPRCKVRVKCGRCSYAHGYAVAVPRDLYEARRREDLIRWRQAKRELSEAGLLEPS